MGYQTNTLLLSGCLALLLSPFAAIAGGHEPLRSGLANRGEARTATLQQSAPRAPVAAPRFAPQEGSRARLGQSAPPPMGAVPNHSGYRVAVERGDHVGSLVPGRDNRTGRDWPGGNWHGAYWPGSSRGRDFVWFLPVLPALYGVYYFGGVPYYYANNAYYLWSEADLGYVAIDPPPLNDSDVAPAPAVSVYLYPAQGQSEAEQSADRQDCEDWANSQAGTNAPADDYRRALIACATARGYSAN